MSSSLWTTRLSFSRNECLRRFRAVITGSPLLQKKLFLAPAKLEELLDTTEEEPEDLREWSFGSPGYCWLPKGDFDINDWPGLKLESFLVNPLLRKYFEYVGKGAHESQGWGDNFNKSAAWTRRAASLFQMYIFQPVPEDAEFEFRVNTSRFDVNTSIKSREIVSGSDTSGPRTFGKLLDSAVQAVCEKRHLSKDATLDTVSIETSYAAFVLKVKDTRASFRTWGPRLRVHRSE